MIIVQSADTPGEYGPCVKCGRPASHYVSNFVLCCGCYIWNGGIPADWHPDCISSKNRYQDVPRNKVLE